ncbi:MAG: hypothetical protein ACJ8F7_10490 [Gemmataceae bacterium]
MPTEAKPLFRPDALRPALSSFTLPPAAVAARPKPVNWATLLASTKADAFKETELWLDLLTDLFVDLNKTDRDCRPRPIRFVRHRRRQF